MVMFYERLTIFLGCLIDLETLIDADVLVVCAGVDYVGPVTWYRVQQSHYTMEMVFPITQ
jgi:hypothetical protein